jgi:hypothetical protein
MKQILKTVLHQPRLDTVLMIEDSIKKYSGEFTKFQLWRKLPRSVMYQTFTVVLDYLRYSNKIAFDIEGKVVWIFCPELYLEYVNRKDLAE